MKDKRLLAFIAFCCTFAGGLDAAQGRVLWALLFTALGILALMKVVEKR